MTCLLLPKRGSGTAGTAMVLTGYLSNQDNLTGEEFIALQAYKSLSAALDKAIEEDEQS